MAKTRRVTVRRTTHDAATALARRSDDLMNVLTGLGTSRDKRRGSQIYAAKLTVRDCEELFRGNDMAAKIAEEPAREMTRRWLDVQIEGDKQAAEAMERELDRLKLRDRIREAVTKARWAGGAGIVLGANDGAILPGLPLNLGSLRVLRFLTVFDAEELRPRTYYTNPFDEKFGTPETYTVQPQGIAATYGAAGNVVHESRVVRFEGVRISRRQLQENQGWGDSVYVRVNEVLHDFGLSWGSAAHLIQDFGQAVYKIQGLAELLASNQDELVKKRLELLDVTRSVVRAAVLDAGDGSGASGEDFERKATPLSGLPELLDRFCTRLAAAADMPVSRLMGDPPSGLNATGKADITWWYDRISALQDEVIADPVRRVIQLAFLAKSGPTRGKEPKNWGIRFRPLRELSPLEEADRRLKIAQADAAWVGVQVLLPEEVAESRFGGDEFSSETVIDMELRRKMAEEESEPDDAENEPDS